MRWMTHEEEAKIRLAAWGYVVRNLTRQGPALHPYSEQPFLNQRVDGDTQVARMEYDTRLDEAHEVEEWMNRIKDVAPKHYIAGVIVYVVYPWRHQFEVRLADWQKETGLKQASRIFITALPPLA